MQFGEIQCLFDLDTALLSETQMAKGLQLFVNRLSFYTTSEQLKKLFSPFGVVTEARLVKDPRTQRPKGFGFVTFESEADAQNALNSLNGRIVDGRLIFVEVAETTEAVENKTSQK
ncbi:cold-inducible RNA-binding protein-like [Solanum tuberosum]|uniref:cold-inducible RNA-binding protein-like n=1 Tax=Solanum tuberosum TaxID=4113 RepID=UPI00073A2168|nr:PREDICTED: cold-inducible RNA-binding protein-like [Solanum tuberosum]